MRHTEFWDRLETALGRDYAHSWAKRFVITDLGGLTVVEALAAGTDPKEVWRAVHAVLELPARER